MRLADGTRRWAIRLAWAGLLVAVSLLIGLRLGRPLYYTDGAQQVAASELVAGGMVRWNTPEAIAELPGPVQGRVAELPDGRLVYGRTIADGTTDLVVFDARRPQTPPEPAYGLNSAHNELAPAVAADGRLYFASDRPEGVGGYDLYVASWTATGFGVPVPVPICNSALDETDPAPHPDTDELVFVRIDRRVAEGRGGELWRVRLDASFDATPVFVVPAARRAAWAADRDPAFAAGGNALWFVRQAASAPPQLLRASRLADQFDAPRQVGSAWGSRHLRAPLPGKDGLHLGLLQPRGADGGADLWLRATAEELPPWWPGQRWLEWLLLGAAGICALLLVLFHLGRRWSAMDLVAQCLLLSLLLHVLLFLWLMGVEIAGSPLPGDDEQGRLQVMVVTTAASASASGGPAASDVAARVAFATDPRPLEVTPPTAAPEAVQRTLSVAGAEAQWQADASARDVDAQATLQDRAAEWDRRSEVAAVGDPAAAHLPELERAAAAAAAAAVAARGSGAVDVVTVVAPAASVPHQSTPRHLLSEAVVVPLAVAQSTPAPAAELQDAAIAAAVRAAPPATANVEAAAVSVVEAAPAAPAVQREADGTTARLLAAVPTGAAPKSQLAAAPARLLVAPPALAATAPVARGHAAVAAVRDGDAETAAASTLATAAAPIAAVASAAAQAVQPHAATLAASRGAVALASPPPPAVPDTALARAASAVVAPARTLPQRAVEGHRVEPVAVPPLRDRTPLAAESRPSTATFAPATIAAPAEVATVAAAKSAPLGAPMRGLAQPAPAERIAPPGSQLVRHAAKADLVRRRLGRWRTLPRPACRLRCRCWTAQRPRRRCPARRPRWVMRRDSSSPVTVRRPRRAAAPRWRHRRAPVRQRSNGRPSRPAACWRVPAAASPRPLVAPICPPPHSRAPSAPVRRSPIASLPQPAPRRWRQPRPACTPRPCASNRSRPSGRPCIAVRALPTHRRSPSCCLARC
jgi:hypothetical protein